MYVFLWLLVTGLSSSTSAPELQEHATHESSLGSVSGSRTYMESEPQVCLDYTKDTVLGIINSLIAVFKRFRDMYSESNDRFTLSTVVQDSFNLVLEALCDDSLRTFASNCRDSVLEKLIPRQSLRFYHRYPPVLGILAELDLLKCQIAGSTAFCKSDSLDNFDREEGDYTEDEITSPPGSEPFDECMFTMDDLA